MTDDKPKFTPGPWHESDDMSDPVYITCARRKICSINYIEPYAESDANAALIAAAPEMYQMLQAIFDMVDAYGHITLRDNAANDIRELLAKARGEEGNG